MVRLQITGWKNGFMFGLKVGAFTWGALCLGLLSISTAPLELMTGWFIGQTIESGLGALIAGAGLVSEKPGHLAAWVLLFFFLIVAFTITLQSLGLVEVTTTLDISHLHGAKGILSFNTQV
jgi:hypothetical protein